MSSYPSISPKDAEELFELHKLGNLAPDEFEKRVEGQFEHSADQERVLETLERLLELADAEGIMNTKNYQPFEAKAAVLIHEEGKLREEWVRDGGFWRWLTFADRGTAAQLIDVRYGQSAAPGSAKKEHYGFETVNRGYLAFLWMRADAVYNSVDGYSLVSKVLDLDFWRSHVVRIDQGCCHELVQAFVKYVADKNLPRGEANNPNEPAGFRDLAKELSRRFPTMAFELMDSKSAYSFIDLVWGERKAWCNKD